MGEIVQLKTRTRTYTFETGQAAGLTVQWPNSASEYLAIAKRVLAEHEYKTLLLGIMDEDYYNLLNKTGREIVDTYKNF